ncbi:MAG: Holliday junction resolvase RuvX [Cytophagales bacterium]|nr:MAG: Holliday junction resolvase RuvX [Cytophagales bacterium]
MGRILAIDYGEKRIGLAVTDPLQIIATPLDTIDNGKIWDYLREYIKKESVEAIVIGLPLSLKSEDTTTTVLVRSFAEKLAALFPDLPLHWEDERFSSKIAQETMIAGGTSKKYRKEKGNLDKISATIILQSFLAKKT